MRAYVATRDDHGACAVAQAIEDFGKKRIRLLLGDQDVCNCMFDGYKNAQSEVCYPSPSNNVNNSAGGVGCIPNDFGGEFNGVKCCDTYPDTMTSNVVDYSCSVRALARHTRAAHIRDGLAGRGRRPYSTPC